MGRKQNFVGFKSNDQGFLRERFLFDGVPTEETYGKAYSAVMGPFRTKLRALACVHFGEGNPHTTTTAACDRIGQEHADELRGKPDRRFISTPAAGASPQPGG